MHALLFWKTAHTRRVGFGRPQSRLPVSNLDMSIRWSIVLPVIGLCWFAAVTYQSARRDLGYSDLRKHFVWSTFRLDSDPLAWKNACAGQIESCVVWDPSTIDSWSRPTPLAKFLIVFALPAFLLSLLAVGFAGRHGVNQIIVFFALTPLLIVSWFYFLGRVADRIYRRSQAPVAL
jgi:hypothetical protein